MSSPKIIIYPSSKSPIPSTGYFHEQDVSHLTVAPPEKPCAMIVGGAVAVFRAKDRVKAVDLKDFDSSVVPLPNEIDHLAPSRMPSVDLTSLLLSEPVQTISIDTKKRNESTEMK